MSEYKRGSEYRWKRYSTEELTRISVDGPIHTKHAAATCPSCQQLTLHWYYYEIPIGRRPGVTLLWCMICRKAYWADQVPLSPNYSIEDPLDGTDLKKSVMSKHPYGVFKHLERQWKDGTLPQRISKLRDKKRGMPPIGESG
ncbi:hypothetical protein, partial [Nocardia sp. NPDC058497]|uniref:hypothetical protein n=1 Tax=Nocardia sp. NPDC058497 TaxID=3346529 RepID=UPI003665D9E6